MSCTSRAGHTFPRAGPGQRRTVPRRTLHSRFTLHDDNTADTGMNSTTMHCQWQCCLCHWQQCRTFRSDTTAALPATKRYDPHTLHRNNSSFRIRVMHVHKPTGTLHTLAHCRTPGPSPTGTAAFRCTSFEFLTTRLHFILRKHSVTLVCE